MNQSTTTNIPTSNDDLDTLIQETDALIGKIESDLDQVESINAEAMDAIDEATLNYLTEDQKIIGTIPPEEPEEIEIDEDEEV